VGSVGCYTRICHPLQPPAVAVTGHGNWQARRAHGCDVKRACCCVLMEMNQDFPEMLGLPTMRRSAPSWWPSWAISDGSGKRWQASPCAEDGCHQWHHLTSQVPTQGGSDLPLLLPHP